MSLHRAVEIIALNVFDLHTLQYSELLRGLDTFHADADADGLRQLRHHFDKGLGVGILRQIFDKALIHLNDINGNCLLYTSPSPRDRTRSRMPSSA